MRGNPSALMIGHQEFRQQMPRSGLETIFESNQPASVDPATVGSLVLLVLVVNLVVLGLLMAYGFLNLLPDIPDAHQVHPQTYVTWATSMGVVGPTLASIAFVLPLLIRSIRQTRGQATLDEMVPNAIALRAASAPLVLASFSFSGWLLVAGYVATRAVFGHFDIPAGHAAHFISRPMLAGLVATTATFFAAEHLCRTRIWPALLATTRIAGNAHLWRVRVRHRLVALWLVIGALPLSAVALTTLPQVAGANLSVDPASERLAYVLLLIAVSATVGGAWFAWIVALSVTQPLGALEIATARLSAGDFDTRVPVNATDEFGALAEGFNFAAASLSRTNAELEARNSELAEALNRVVFLEHVKRGLDRFVPDTVRRAIEKNPQAPALAKQAKDVTVLFLDIEGYTQLSETLPRTALNALVERYFSLFLTSIRAEGGDINETAGDGLMIIFQSLQPGEHAVAAVRAALAIREQTSIANSDSSTPTPWVAVNIGISSGECDVGATRFKGPAGERWTFTASGPVTNLAARLGDHAKGGQILLASGTAGHVQKHFQLRSLGLILLKNMPQMEEAWEIGATQPTQSL